MIAEQSGEEGGEVFEDGAAEFIDCPKGFDAEAAVEGNDGEVFADDTVTVGFEKFAGGFAGVETDVGAIHNAAVRVVEPAEEEIEADKDIGDVRDGDNDGTAGGAEDGEDVAEKAVGLIEVFEHVED